MTRHNSQSIPGPPESKILSSYFNILSKSKNGSMFKALNKYTAGWTDSTKSFHCDILDWIVRWAVFSQWIKILWKFKIPLRQAAARERVAAQNIAQGDLLHSFSPPPSQATLGQKISANWTKKYLQRIENVHT